MKNIFLTIVLSALSLLTLQAQTPGELTVSVATSEAGGNYAPRNIVAIWIEDDAGNFQKTLLAYAQNRRTHLNNWQATTAAAGSEYNTVDAVTGATKSSHSTRTCSWDGTDFNSQLLADGTYHLWMELTDKNSTGNYSSFTFTKSDIAESQIPGDVPSFGSISISWEPSDPTDVFETGKNETIAVYPNPGKGLYTIESNQVSEVEVKTVSGILVLKGTSRTIDISNQPDGVYLFVIKTEAGIVTNKVVKK